MSDFLYDPLRSFFLCYPGEALEGPILTGFVKFNNVDSQNDGQKDHYVYIYIYKTLNETPNGNFKNTHTYIYIYIYI